MTTLSPVSPVSPARPVVAGHVLGDTAVLLGRSLRHIARSVDTAEVTAFGQNDKAYIAGLRDATIPLEGFADATVDGYLAGILGWGTPVAWEVYPSGSATGLVKYSGSAILTKYETQTSVSDAVKISGELQVTGAITRAVL